MHTVDDVLGIAELVDERAPMAGKIVWEETVPAGGGTCDLFAGRVIPKGLYGVEATMGVAGDAGSASLSMYGGSSTFISLYSLAVNRDAEASFSLSANAGATTSGKVLLCQHSGDFAPGSAAQYVRVSSGSTTGEKKVRIVFTPLA